MSALYSSGVLGLHFPACRAGGELNVNTCESPLASIQGFHCTDTHPASLSPGYPPTRPESQTVQPVPMLGEEVAGGDLKVSGMLEEPRQ